MAARDRLIRALFITEKQCADGKPREQANRDINDAIAYYLSESAAQASHGFIDSLEQAYTHISRHPATGCSPRYATNSTSLAYVIGR